MTHSFNEAKQLYMEQYGSALVDKSYLKLALLIVSIIALLLIALNIRTQSMVKNFKPLVIRIDEVGRAERVHYQSFEYTPRELEIKYFLNQFITHHYSRHQATFKDDYTQSLAFLEKKLATTLIDTLENGQAFNRTLSDPTALQIDVTVTQIVLTDFGTPPYKARVDFETVHKTPKDLKAVLKESFTATIVFDFTDTIDTHQALTNPLGLTITDYRADKAFK